MNTHSEQNRVPCFSRGWVFVVVTIHGLLATLWRHGDFSLETMLLVGGSLLSVSVARYASWATLDESLRGFLVFLSVSALFYCFLSVISGPPSPGVLSLAFGALFAWTPLGDRQSSRVAAQLDDATDEASPRS